jgi:hypothetical protein
MEQQPPTDPAEPLPVLRPPIRGKQKTEDTAADVENRRAESVAQNLHDERTIEVLNAKFTVKESELDGDSDEAKEAAEKNHVGLMATELVTTFQGIENHLVNELTFIREAMRAVYNAEIETWEGPKDNRRILTAVADKGQQMARAVFDDLSWADRQNEHNYAFIDKQAPEGAVKKLTALPGRVVKGTITAPITGVKKILGLRPGGKHKL